MFAFVVNVPLLHTCVPASMIAYVSLISFRRFLLFESMLWLKTFELEDGASLSYFVVCIALVGKVVGTEMIGYVGLIFTYCFVLSESLICFLISVLLHHYSLFGVCFALRCSVHMSARD